MRRVIVACGCGISSRFMVERLKRYLGEQGILLEVSAANEYEVAQREADVILVGIPLKYKFQGIKEEVAKHFPDTRVVLIDKKTYEEQDMANITRLALEALGETL